MDERTDRLHGITFAELVVFMEDRLADEKNFPPCIFTLRLDNKTTLEQLGTTMRNIIYTTKLKDILLLVLPDLRAQSQGQTHLFEKYISPAPKKACEPDTYVMHIIREAHVVRRETFEPRFTSDGTFQTD